MKKIIILMAGILFSANMTFAMEVSATGMASIDSNGNISLIENFDNLVDDVKNDCICTMEYNPVCGQQDEDLVTFGNQCEFDCANKNGRNVKFLYHGECKDKKKEPQRYKKEIKIPEIDTCPLNMINPVPCIQKGGKLVARGKDPKGCVLGWKCVIDEKNKNNNKENSIDGSVTNSISVRNDWVKVDEYFSFNTKTKEWKGDNCICHTCTPENGFTKDGQIIFDGVARESCDKTDVSKEVKKNISQELKMVKSTALKTLSADFVIDTKKEDDGKNYIVTVNKKTKFLGLFDFNEESEVKINVKTGVVIKINKPWYSFLLF